jgi:hypothetical protein
MNFRHTNESILSAVAKSKSWAGVCRNLGIRAATGGQSHIKKRAVAAGANFSHFTGQGWNKGGGYVKTKPLTYYLQKNGPFIKSNDLKRKLFNDGVKDRTCELCFGSTWMGKPIPLELDHIDGDHDNNLLINLRIICPNCHAQTDTYCGKNIGY